MRAAPAMRAPCTTERPMPPSPMTSTVAPSSTRAVFSTAPTPVCTAQPITQSDVERHVGGYLDGARRRHEDVLGEAADVDAAEDHLLAAREARRAVGKAARHEAGRVHAAARLAAHAPVAGAARRDRRQHDVVARARPCTPGRPARRRPRPRVRARSAAALGNTPSTMLRSEWQIPQAWTRTRTWPGPGVGDLDVVADANGLSLLLRGRRLSCRGG